MKKNAKETLRVYSYYTKNYKIFSETFLNTYNGDGCIAQDVISDMDHDCATSIKPNQFYLDWALHKNDYDYFVFADIDLIFHSSFCFSELCKSDSVGIIYRPQFDDIPQRKLNSSIVTVPSKFGWVIERWKNVAQESEIYNLTKNQLLYNRIPNLYYWDQISLLKTLEKIPIHTIDPSIYLSQAIEKNTKIVTPNSYTMKNKMLLYDRLMDEVHSNWTYVRNWKNSI